MGVWIRAAACALCVAWVLPACGSNPLHEHAGVLYAGAVGHSVSVTPTVDERGWPGWRSEGRFPNAHPASWVRSRAWLLCPEHGSHGSGSSTRRVDRFGDNRKTMPISSTYACMTTKVQVVLHYELWLGDPDAEDAVLLAADTAYSPVFAVRDGGVVRFEGESLQSALVRVPPARLLGIAPGDEVWDAYDDWGWPSTREVDPGGAARYYTWSDPPVAIDAVANGAHESVSSVRLVGAGFVAPDLGFGVGASRLDVESLLPLPMERDVEQWRWHLDGGVLTVAFAGDRVEWIELAATEAKPSG